MSASEASRRAGRPPPVAGPGGLREFSIRTDDEPAQRAYWHNIAACGSAIGMPPFRFEMPATGPGFSSRLRWSEADRVHFLDGETSRAVTQLSRQDARGDVIVVGGLRYGELRIAHGAATETLIEPGTLFVADYGRRMRMDWSPHSFLFLALPRRLVADALGPHADFRGETLHTLPGRGLAPMLWSQLLSMAAQSHALDPQEWQAALTAAAELALGVLRQYFGLGRSFGPDQDTAAPLRNDLLLAARRVIEQRYEQADLTADAIAAATGCSRSQLYRAFAQAGLAVGDCLRELRLSKARAALEAGAADGGLGTLAFQCGYTDLSAFGKAFRRRFGVPPSAWRARA